MDILTFITKMTGALAWPLTLLVAVVLLRNPLSDLLRLLTKVKYGSMEMEFNREVNQLSQTVNAELPSSSASQEEQQMYEKLLQLAVAAPQSAVIEAWRQIENRLVDLAREHNLEVAPRVWTMPLILSSFMLDKGLVTESQDNTIMRAKALRDRAVYTKDMQLSAEEAVNYVNLAISLAASIK